MAQSTPWRQLREAAGITLREAARRADIHPSKLSAVERGLEPDEADRLRHVLSAVLLEKAKT